MSVIIPVFLASNQWDICESFILLLDPFSVHLSRRGEKVDEKEIKSDIGGGVRGLVGAARDYFSKINQAAVAIQIFLS